MNAFPPPGTAAKRLKVLIFLDHPIMVRHFVSSGAFAGLERDHDVRYVVLPEGHKRRTGTDLTMLDPARIVELPESIERSKIWKRLFQIERLRQRKTAQDRALARHHRKAIGAATARVYTLYGLPVIWPIYRRMLWNRVGQLTNQPLRDLLDAEQPDVVVHPTVMDGSFLNDLVDELGRRRIPLIAIMNSWDNPSTKRAMVGSPDWLLVWGQQTADHAVRYAGMPADRVVIFGAAQFDVYREPPSLDRAEFCRRHGLDPAKLILVYAGSSKGCDEYADLDCLESAIEAGQLSGVSIVYRPHPWGDCGRDGGRIAARDWRHVVFEASMADYVRNAGQGSQGITTPDYRHTRDLLANVDAVMSPLSTILLEAALNGRPSLCLVDDDDVDNWFLKISTELIHFAEFFEKPEFLVSRGRGELIAKTQALVAKVRDPGAPAVMLKAADYFARSFERPYCERLEQFVVQVAAR